jgi:hypothetical protein
MQLELFDRDKMLREEIREALAQMDVCRAEQLVDGYRKLQDAEPLEWEPDLLATERQWPDPPGLGDPAAGLDCWNTFTASPLFARIPPSDAADLEKAFFSRLVRASRGLPEGEEIARQVNWGELYLRAGELRSAQRWFEREIKAGRDGWELRLQLGNCLVPTSPAAAEIHYVWAFLLGMPIAAQAWINDRDLQGRLASKIDPEWAFPEAMVEAELRTPGFGSRSEFETFVEAFLPAESDLPEELPRQFGIRLVVSENRSHCSDGLLLRVRLEMKRLNPRLHAQYMRRIEG